jgi:hypothetical protein
MPLEMTPAWLNAGGSCEKAPVADRSVARTAGRVPRSTERSTFNVDSFRARIADARVHGFRD